MILPANKQQAGASLKRGTPDQVSGAKAGTSCAGDQSRYFGTGVAETDRASVEAHAEEGCQ